MKAKGECRLCGNVGELRNSHVLPAFVFRWIRDSSATGHIRFGEEPNHRIQDGWKRRWLCSICENQIGAAERQFSQQVFRPVVDDRIGQAKYGPWMLEFCVSVTWRVLLFFREIDSFDDYSQGDRDLLDRAAAAWRNYLLGKTTDLAPFRQHLYVIPGIWSNKPHVASNINQHVLRHVDTDVVRSEHQLIVYVKLPRLFVMGVLRDERPNDWQGTEVHAEGGLICRDQTVPAAFWDHLNRRAKRTAFLLTSMSDRQKAKVLEDVRSDPVRVARSDTMKALRLDEALDSLREHERGE